jgi:hypothetical protein
VFEEETNPIRSQAKRKRERRRKNGLSSQLSGPTAAWSWASAPSPTSCAPRCSPRGCAACASPSAPWPSGWATPLLITNYLSKQQENEEEGTNKGKLVSYLQWWRCPIPATCRRSLPQATTLVFQVQNQRLLI